ncbi:unnamed protein product, partial [Staurois parvus]
QIRHRVSVITTLNPFLPAPPGPLRVSEAGRRGGRGVV